MFLKALFATGVYTVNIPDSSSSAVIKGLECTEQSFWNAILNNMESYIRKRGSQPEVLLGDDHQFKKLKVSWKIKTKEDILDVEDPLPKYSTSASRLACYSMVSDDKLYYQTKHEISLSRDEVNKLITTKCGEVLAQIGEEERWKQNKPKLLAVAGVVSAVVLAAWLYL